MTQHVDQNGQVVVRAYTTFEGAVAGFDRLKERGLHCAVVSTPQCELEGEQERRGHDYQILPLRILLCLPWSFMH